MKTVEMAHGSGGQAMQQLIGQLFMAAFDNPWLAEQEDQARIALSSSPRRATGWHFPLTATSSTRCFSPAVISASWRCAARRMMWR